MALFKKHLAELHTHADREVLLKLLADEKAKEPLGSIERGLTHELEGTVHLDFRPDGLVCTMDIPLPKGTRDG